ncbi:vWA domain-containing protein [Hydrogenimonas urashimensis]|uniref:vWA domain-containing protein n=1 Tax=Hydrogenimonas urashimensis TaxID=2740515 RepID=UPI00191654FD|nr:VWA domain-containing protein [Hydrogenimonas urashimensis]
MSFLHPFFLWLLLPLGLFTWLRFRQERRNSLPLHPRVILENRRTLLVRLAPFLALGWMVVALARPVTKEAITITAPTGGTLCLAIDASRSMMATDRKPNRFAFAKAATLNLVNRDSRHKYALIAFTTNALILSPPTEDKALIHAALEAFRPDYILTHGTSIEALLRYVGRLGGENKDLVIFSDGGDEEDLAKLAEVARKNHIRIFGVACGSRRGSTIPSESGWLRDKNGRLVVSTQNPILENLAEATGGAFIDESTPDAAADAILEQVDDQLKRQSARRTAYREWFWLPLLLGIGFFLAGTLSTAGLMRRLWPLLALLGIHAQAGLLDYYHLSKGIELYHKGAYEKAAKAFAKVDPPLLESRYGLGASLYKMGAYKKAGRVFASIKSSDPAVKAAIFYNLGNCAVKIGRFKSARDYYVKALQLTLDPDAKANLQKVLFLLEKRRSKVQPKANRHVKAATDGGSSAERKEKGAKKSDSQHRMGQGSGAQSATKSMRIGIQKGASQTTPRHPLSSKVYEMINKGYVHEERPW